MAGSDMETTQYVFNINHHTGVMEQVSPARQVQQQRPHGMGPPPPPLSHLMSSRSKRDFANWIATGDMVSLTDTLEEWNRFPDYKIFSIPGTDWHFHTFHDLDPVPRSRVKALEDLKPSAKLFSCKVRATWKGHERFNPVTEHQQNEKNPNLAGETVVGALSKFEYGVDYHFDIIDLTHASTPILTELPACIGEARLRLSGSHHFAQDDLFPWGRHTRTTTQASHEAGYNNPGEPAWAEYRWEVKAMILIPDDQLWEFFRSSLRPSTSGDVSTSNVLNEILGHYFDTNDGRNTKDRATQTCYEAIDFVEKCAIKATNKSVVMTGHILSHIFDFAKCTKDTNLVQRVCKWSSEWRIPIHLDFFTEFKEFLLGTDPLWCYHMLPQCVATLVKVFPTLTKRLEVIEYLPDEIWVYLQMQTRETPLTLCLNQPLEELEEHIGWLVRSREDGKSLITATCFYGPPGWFKATMVPSVLACMKRAENKCLWKWIGWLNMIGRDPRRADNDYDDLPITPTYLRETYRTALRLFAEKAYICDLVTVFPHQGHPVNLDDAIEFIRKAAVFDGGRYLQQMLRQPAGSSRPTDDEYATFWAPLFRNLADEEPPNTPQSTIILEAFHFVTKEYIRNQVAERAAKEPGQFLMDIWIGAILHTVYSDLFKGDETVSTEIYGCRKLIYRHLKKDPSLRIDSVTRTHDGHIVKMRIYPDEIYQKGQFLYLAEVEQRLKRAFSSRGGRLYSDFIRRMSRDSRRSLLRLEFVEHPGVRRIAEKEKAMVDKIRRAIDQGESSQRGTKRSGGEPDEPHSTVRMKLRTKRSDVSSAVV